MSIRRVLVAGLSAAAGLAILLVVQALSHGLTQYQLIEMIDRLTGGPLFVGWLVYALIGGLVLPIIFLLVYDRLAGATGVVKGLAFGLFVWLVMILVFLPLVGAGLAGLVIGWAVPGVALVQHLVYGAVLGSVYRPKRPPARTRNRRARRRY